MRYKLISVANKPEFGSESTAAGSVQREHAAFDDPLGVVAGKKKFSWPQNSASPLARYFSKVPIPMKMRHMEYQKTLPGLLRRKQTYFKPLDNIKHKHKLNEACPCCMGLPEFDEAIALTKYVHIYDESVEIAKHSDGHFQSDQHLDYTTLPSSSLEYFFASLTGYLALGGMYMGLLNYSKSADRVTFLNKKGPKILKNLHRLSDQYRDFFRDPQVAPLVKPKQEEWTNLITYHHSIRHSIQDGRFHQFAASPLQFSGAAGVFAGMFHTPVLAPAMGMMSLYAFGHAGKAGFELYRLSKSAPLPKSDSTSEFIKTGTRLYQRRQKAKRNYLRAIFPSWMVYGSGTTMLGIGTAMGLAGIAFPPFLLGLGGAFLGVGLAGVVYYGQKFGNRYHPKNKDAIDRQKLGSDSEIIRKLGYFCKERQSVMRFKRRLRAKLTRPQSWSLFLRKLGNFGFSFLTLGLTPWSKRMKHNQAITFGRHVGNPIPERYAYFKESTLLQLDFLKEEKQVLHQEYRRFSERARLVLQPLNKPEMKTVISGIERHLLQKQEDLDQKITAQKKLLTLISTANISDESTQNLKLMWCFLAENRLLAMVLDHLYRDHALDLESYRPYILIESCSNTHPEYPRYFQEKASINKSSITHSDITFDLEALVEGVHNQDKTALKLYNEFCLYTDQVLINLGKEDFDYTIGALSDHLQDRRIPFD